MSYVPYEGLPDLEVRGFFEADASGTMAGTEVKTGKPKHQRVAWLVQQLLNRMDDPQYAEASLDVIGFSADSTGVKILTLLEDHNPYSLKSYTGNTKDEFWDLLTPEHRAQGMGGRTPIGSALAFARERAEEWVNAASGQVQRRAVIYLLSDGMNNVGPDGMAEKDAIIAFNNSSEKGQIRLATIGYFQSEPDSPQEEPEEKEGRKLLKDLPLNPDAYFESDNVEEILRYILGTFTQAMNPQRA